MFCPGHWGFSRRGWAACYVSSPVAVRLDSASKRAAARVGSVIKDKWTLDRLIGVGGMAAVYAATHRNKKRAAIKMLHAELSLDSVMKERFLREGYAANSVGQRGAVEVDDDDVTEDGCAFIVMELLDGETLDTRWERKDQRLPPQEVLSLMDQLLETLAAAHAKGIVHRDIKPENLFLTRDGVVKVLDFRNCPTSRTDRSSDQHPDLVIRWAPLPSWRRNRREASGTKSTSVRTCGPSVRPCSRCSPGNMCTKAKRSTRPWRWP